MTAMSKKQLRKELRSLHKGPEAVKVQSQLICRHILASGAYQNARVVGGYIPMSHEADITPVLKHALQAGKRLVLPLCQVAPHMTLREVFSLEDLTPGAYGIPEPSSDAREIPLDKVDLLLVPLEGVDKSGYRLGKGGGYYDWLLSGVSMMTIGCALKWQWVDVLPRDPWDRPLSACADSAGLHLFSKESV